HRGIYDMQALPGRRARLSRLEREHPGAPADRWAADSARLAELLAGVAARAGGRQRAARVGHLEPSCHATGQRGLPHVDGLRGLVLNQHRNRCPEVIVLCSANDTTLAGGAALAA